MICVNLLSGFQVTPTCLKHATEPGHITLTDSIITMFMFAIGVAMELTFPRSRARIGTGRTVWRFARRNLVLIGFGLLGSLILRRDLLGEWGVFQAIGGAGLVALPFMFLPPRYRPAVAVVLIAIYEIIVGSGHAAWLKAHDTGHLGGVPGAFAWAGVVLIASFAGSFIGNHKGGTETRFRLAGIVIGVAGIGLALLLKSWLPIFKPMVTATYLLVTAGAAALILLVFSLLDLRFLPFKVFGVNALAVFMLHGILIETAPRVLSPASPPEAVLLALAAVYGLCFLLAGLLYRGRVFIRL